MMLIKKNVAVISKSFDKTNKERNAVKYKFRKCDTVIKGNIRSSTLVRLFKDFLCNWCCDKDRRLQAAKSHM